MGDLAWTCPESDDFDADRRGVTRWYRDGRVMRTQDVGVAVRATMPVVLGSGHPATLGVWVGVDDRDHWVHSRFEAGWGGFTFHGYLLNAPEPWPQVFGAPVTLEAVDGPEPAAVVGSGHEVLQRVLSGENQVRPRTARQ